MEFDFYVSMNPIAEINWSCLVKAAIEVAVYWSKNAAQRYLSEKFDRLELNTLD